MALLPHQKNDVEVERISRRNMENDEQKYNGWKNYETWAVALWLDNDEFMNCFWREAAGRAVVEAHSSPKVVAGGWSAVEVASLNLADQIKEEVENSSPLEEASLYSDLLNGAFQSVDWMEVANGFLEDSRNDNEQ